MNRRELITLLGGAAVAWPVAARAQQKGERMRRIGVLMNLPADDTEGQARLAAFTEALKQLGWSDGSNLRIDTRWSVGDAERGRRYAVEVVALTPDVIVAAGGPLVRAVQLASRTVPIVFAQSIDPVGAGIVASLARPGGNATGFTQFEYSLSGKWPELLKEVAPQVTRVAVLRDASNAAGIGQWAVIQAMVPSFRMELTPLEVHDAGEIERGIAAFARSPNGGLIVPQSAGAHIHRKLIVEQAGRHRLPAVYPYRYFVTGGGLISYGPDLATQYRGAAGYVDRILKGAKPSDLPVQNPTKYETVLNLKTAKALGIDVPTSVLLRATEVIE